ncbi:MAG: aminodeoxychorismate/anthranilate synthase component II [Gammaproteobacteria bacterium]|nr:aminodeoxychorismate/anthranilate synthase component II [Gammaproteobacteria bacterium]
MLLMIDNYDSFTYNLVQYFRELGQDVIVKRNDSISLSEMDSLNPDYLVVSPGPRTPTEAGISCQAIKHFAGKIPILGVCLGHQSISQVFGGKIIKAPKVMHGYTSEIQHSGEGVFRNLPNSFIATRYHSLVVDRKTLSKDFEITAWSTSEDKNSVATDDLIMGIKHKKYDIEGIQFHPESILTEHGHQILKNFLED